MSIFGVGTDIVEIQRFQNIDTSKMAHRILCLEELQYFEQEENKMLFIAKRFATKEAVSKAFGTGIGKRLSFQDITISKNQLGKPLCFVKESVCLAIVQSKCNIHISLTDTKTLIQAYCIIETTT